MGLEEVGRSCKWLDWRRWGRVEMKIGRTWMDGAGVDPEIYGNLKRGQSVNADNMYPQDPPGRLS